MAHLKEKMPEILAASEKGKTAFYSNGRVVILDKKTTWRCETRGTKLKLAVWNYNGSMKLDVGAFKDNFKGRDIIFYSETIVTWDGLRECRDGEWGRGLKAFLVSTRGDSNKGTGFGDGWGPREPGR